MAKRRLLVAVVAVVLGSLTATGAALAEEAQPQRDRGDHRAFCERLQSKAEELRAAIGRLEAMSDMIKRKIASGELTEEQLIRARHHWRTSRRSRLSCRRSSGGSWRSTARGVVADETKDARAGRPRPRSGTRPTELFAPCAGLSRLQEASQRYPRL